MIDNSKSHKVVFRLDNEIYVGCEVTFEDSKKRATLHQGPMNRYFLNGPQFW